MKPFRYSLEPVLTLRAREKEQAFSEYARSVQRRCGLEAAHEEGRRSLERLRGIVAHGSGESFSGAARAAYFAALEEARGSLENLAAELDRARDEEFDRLEAFLKARRNEEALRRLKEKRALEHNLSELHREEEDLGDLINGAYARRAAN